jgi:hypothetical protein
MRRTRTPRALTLALLLAACDVTTAGPDPVMIPGPTAVVTLHETAAPFQFVVTTCVEDVIGEGRLHVLATETISAAEDTITAFHVNARGTGVGSASGARYRFNDTFTTRTLQHRQFPFQSSLTDVLKLIGHGGAADLHVRTTFRVVFNANGIETVSMNTVPGDVWMMAVTGMPAYLPPAQR